MTDDQRKMLEEGCAQLESRAGLVWGPEYIEEFAAAIRAALVEIDALKADANLVSLNAVNAALAAEVAALKAHDPLAEMWRELAEYQEQADKDGHGESWRIMCSERTTPAAWEAWGAAVRVLARHEARVAARSAGDAASLHSAFDAVTAIRKAKEAKP
jgi:hypothetical protein